jgi:parallel beta-helix repeat protein
MDGLPSNLTKPPVSMRRTAQLLSYLAGVGIFAGLPWSGMQTIVLAADPPNSTYLAQATGAQPVKPINLIFVHPNIGNDQTGNGTQPTPFKTISRALQVASSNTVILLAPGTYSTQTGETFPLYLKPGVTIQGNPHLRGQNTVIRGGGSFLSPSSASQNVTIVGANQAGLTGVTVTNPNTQGYGLWLESTSPLVIDNIFTANTADGIAIAGNSAPVIRNNYFYQNRTSGIAVYGTSRAEIRQNLFENTGFGINIAQNATPLLIGNRILRNTDGVVVQANARPILRGNVIEENGRDGLVAIANARPDLGLVTEPGGNLFRNNGRLDVNATAIGQQISAFGNQLNTTRIAGQVDLLGAIAQKAPIVANQAGASSGSNAAIARAEIDQTKQVSVYPSRPATQPVQRTAQPTAARSDTSAVRSDAGSELTAATFPVPASLGQTPTARSGVQSPGSANFYSSANQTVVSQSPRSSRSSTVASNPQPRLVSTAKPQPVAIPIAVPPPETNAPPTQPSRLVPVATTPQPTVIPIAVPPPETNRSTPRVARPATPTPVAVAAPAPAISTPPVGSQVAPQSFQNVVISAPPKRFQAPVPTASTSGQRTATGRRSLPAPTEAIAATASAPSSAIPIAVPPPESSRLVPLSTPDNLDTIAAPPLSVQPSTGTKGMATPGILPVPGPDIPLGNGGGTSNFVATRPSSQNGEPPLPPGQAEALGLRYRVVVDVSSDDEQQQVKSLVPNAFQAFSGGRSVMQAGAFGDRANAEQLQQMLASQGLRATVESLE